MRAIQGGMTQPTQAMLDTTRRAQRKTRVRPDHQAAQVILRMSEPERAVVHSAALDAGLSAVRYVMDLVAGDAQRRGCGDDGVIAGMFAGTAEDPGHVDRGPHAEAQHAVPAAVEQSLQPLS